MENKYTSLKKVGIICAVLLLTLALGNGMNRAFAGQDISSMLKNWFETKKDSSIEQIDQAITIEKERLMVELREAISAEIQRADAELARFTADETAMRVELLRNHAAGLMEGLEMYDVGEREILIANLNYALERGIELLNGTISELPPTLPSLPGGGGPVLLPGTGNGNPPKPEEGEGSTEAEGDPGVNETDDTTEAEKEPGEGTVVESDKEVDAPSQNDESVGGTTDSPSTDESVIAPDHVPSNPEA